ncbi:WD40 domain-containing protein [Blumeria hordei DH14]|uniref:WD40 domain-containing protein n=1 Tax=Blumeria graminis f. sp. hordei (strain DH14) TaxID=546991 RepID=N1J7W2_BLUG1|nr:WD40 domain-containing protein [Blumeria hordei DH14]
MVKSYLKYEQSKVFGVVSSGTSNVLWYNETNASRTTGFGRAITAANEEVFCWDIKKGELLSRWKDEGNNSRVTVIASSKSDQDVFAVGYEDGSIRIWDSKISKVIVVFNGHRSAITSLQFDSSGFRLASGSKDTDVIVWDVIAEVGLYKLRSHKDQITGLYFVCLDHKENISEDGEELSPDNDPNGSERYLITTGKDALIKLWDIEAQHCIETHVAQTNGECWSLGVFPDGAGCITAGNDGELTVWSIDCAGLLKNLKKSNATKDKDFIQSRGILRCQGRERTQEIIFHPSQDYFMVHGCERAIEIWRIRSEDEVKKSLSRKRKRKREKQTAEGKRQERDTNDSILDHESEDLSSVNLTEIIVSYIVVRTGGKARSVSWMKNKRSKNMQLLVATTNNQLEVFSLPTKEKLNKPKNEEPPDYTRIISVESPAHRADIRALSLSSDDRMLASASNGGLKVWNIKTGSCIRSFECGYALCCAFLPGDKVMVVGTKSGELELFDMVSMVMLDSVKAHEGAIWTLQTHPDGRSLVSGSADKSAKFWSFNIVQEEIPGTKRTTPSLRLSHTRTLKVTDDILSLRFSPDSRLLAISLLDNTVKVFFVDSLKLFLNLYGHKLPVLDLDISFDSKLIVTCSADKNIRIWGLDFGDCHKAFFAHHDSILKVGFVPHNQDGNGHHFFSCSKDKIIKYWDGDKFEQIQKLENHHGEIWALVVSKTGEFFVSASHDKSIRVWEQTDEQIFLEEEKEKELEALYESTLATSLGREDENETGTVMKQTIETLTAGEKVVQALEIGLEDLNLLKEYEVAQTTQPNIAPRSRDPLFMALGGISAEEHVLAVINKIPAAELEDALLVLPFASVPPLFTFLEIFATRSMNIPLTCRILFFMLKVHHRQITSSKLMKPMLERIRKELRGLLNKNKSEIGFNIAAIKVISTRIKDKEVINFVDDETLKPVVSERKRGFVSVS